MSPVLSQIAHLTAAPPRRSMARWGNSVRIAVFAAAVAALSGCGGSSSSSTDATYFRTVNEVPNGGQASISLNGSSPNGALTFETASSYASVSSGTPSYNFTLSDKVGTTYSAPGVFLAQTTSYTALVLGRADITSSTDPRIPQLEVVADDKTTPPTGDVRFRVVHAAPDGPNVDILINGTIQATNVPYAAIGAYINLVAGTESVQINKAGTSTALFSAQSEIFTAGHLYSVILVEPSVTTPTYNLQVVDDTA